MRRLASAVGFALIMIAGAHAGDRLATKAGDLSARQLLQLCTPQSAPADAFCVGYMAGIVDALEHTTWLGDAVRVCLPETVTVGQVRKIIERELLATRDDPKFSMLLDRSASSLAFVSLADKFPCSEEDNARHARNSGRGWTAWSSFREPL